MIIKAIFIGENGSLGYETGKEYELILLDSTIKRRKDLTGVCPYRSVETFLQNWKIKYAETPLDILDRTDEKALS